MASTSSNLILYMQESWLLWTLGNLLLLVLFRNYLGEYLNQIISLTYINVWSFLSCSPCKRFNMINPNCIMENKVFQRRLPFRVGIQKISRMSRIVTAQQHGDRSFWDILDTLSVKFKPSFRKHVLQKTNIWCILSAKLKPPFINVSRSKTDRRIFAVSIQK